MSNDELSELLAGGGGAATDASDYMDQLMGLRA